MAFCQHCGGDLGPQAVVCVHCGAAVPVSAENRPKGHSFVITLILCWCLGFLGVHRFYTGNTGIAVGQLLTCGGLGIWVLIDFILIVAGSYRDGEGRPLVHDE